MNKPKIYKSFEDWQESEKKYIYNSKREEWTTSNVDRIVWNACQASMQAQLDEKDAEIESLKEGMRQLRAIAKDDFKAREIISKYFPSKHSEVL